ncbi:LytR/AlgR family response regulator transcription factor [Yeosuana sp. AK3]
MKVVIVDDEQHSTNRLLLLLEPYKNKVFIETFNSVDCAIDGINTIKPDVVFLDVQIDDKTGFDILKQVDFLNFSLIFTTAYQQYAIDAFKFSAIDYLLKPVTSEDFESAINKAFDRVERNQLSDKMDVLLSHLSASKFPKKISLASTKGFVFIEIDSIIRCESSGNYTYIFTTDKKMHTATKTLKYFEELLVHHEFFRIHNSHLINLHYVKAYAKSGFVTLSDNCKLEVSVRRKEYFLKACSAILK